ncbi:MAG: hypothetical protein ACOC58_04105, partial [Chloroflexota bacterium]
PRPEEYEKVMGQRGEEVTGEWLMRLEQVLLKQSPDSWSESETEYDASDPEVAVRATGGSLAVGVIDSVVSAKELIDGIVGQAEGILSHQGTVGSVVS